MNKREIQSYNSRLGETSRIFLLPTLSQIVLDLILGGFLLLVLNARLIWQYFDQNIFSLHGIAFSTISDNAGALSTILAAITNTRLPQIIFWVFVGAAAYVFIWLAGNFLSNIHNDLAADDYMHPKSYSHVKYWSSVMTRKVIFGLMGGLFLSYLYASVKLLPQLSQVCYSAVASFRPFQSSMVLGVSLLISAVAIHFLAVLIHLVLNSWKFIYKDL